MRVCTSTNINVCILMRVYVCVCIHTHIHIPHTTHEYMHMYVYALVSSQGSIYTCASPRVYAFIRLPTTVPQYLHDDLHANEIRAVELVLLQLWPLIGWDKQGGTHKGLSLGQGQGGGGRKGFWQRSVYSQSCQPFATIHL